MTAAVVALRSVQVPAKPMPVPTTKPVNPFKKTPAKSEPAESASGEKSSEFPTPAELIKRMKDNAAKKAALTKVARAVTKLKSTLTRAEVAEISKRLKAIGGMKLPIPKGIDPTRARPDRKGMRGR